MKIIFVRHGESEANQKGLIQGDNLDTPLTELGKEQAKKVAERLKNEEIEAIYSSHHKRAFETAQEIAKHHRIEIIQDPRIKERHSGTFEGTTKREEAHQHYIKAIFKENQTPEDVSLPEGESFREMLERTKSFINSLEHEGTIIVTTHGGVIRAFLYHIHEPKGIHKARQFMKKDQANLENTSLTIIEIDKKENKHIIHEINSIEHLKN